MRWYDALLQIQSNVYYLPSISSAVANYYMHTLLAVPCTLHVCMFVCIDNYSVLRTWREAVDTACAFGPTYFSRQQGFLCWQMYHVVVCMVDSIPVSEGGEEPTKITLHMYIHTYVHVRPNYGSSPGKPCGDDAASRDPWALMPKCSLLQFLDECVLRKFCVIQHAQEW